MGLVIEQTLLPQNFTIGGVGGSGNIRSIKNGKSTKKIRIRGY